MANAKQQAAADLKRLSLTLKGILALGDDLDKLGSIEQATAEANSRLELLHAQAGDLQQAIDEKTQALAGVKDMADGMAKDAEAAAVASRENASRVAKQILDDAKAQAADLLAGANAAALEINQRAQVEARALQAVEGAIADKQAVLDALNAQIAAVKQQIANLG